MGQSTRRSPGPLSGVRRRVELRLLAKTHIRLSTLGKRDELQTLAFYDNRRKDTQLEIDEKCELCGLFAQ